MDIYEEIELGECPYCGCAGLLEEEEGWCWYVMCTGCGSQTAEVRFASPEERLPAARKAALFWNMGKILRGGLGD
ncbi:MAG: Lar family restriction alleviation protein [Oscillospiraceae bacterium]|nr:Lar family restriction alleviation protein [Oscillospiraceae bacterium]